MITRVLSCGLGESTRLVSEYKNKLQIADSETTRLEGIVSVTLAFMVIMHLVSVSVSVWYWQVERLKGQVARQKSQLEDMVSRQTFASSNDHD